MPIDQILVVAGILYGGQTGEQLLKWSLDARMLRLLRLVRLAKIKQLAKTEKVVHNIYLLLRRFGVAKLQVGRALRTRHRNYGG